MSDTRRMGPNIPGGAFGDIVTDFYRDGHISPRRFGAAIALLGDLQATHGHSGGLVGQTSEKVQTGARELLWPPGGPPGIVALDRRLNRLRPHERHLMRRLVLGKEMARGTIADLGRLSSGYKTDRLRKAVALGLICAFLDTVAEIWEEPA